MTQKVQDLIIKYHNQYMNQIECKMFYESIIDTILQYKSDYTDQDIINHLQGMIKSK